MASKLAVGGTLQLLDQIMSPDSKVSNGYAIVRPPGHHCCDTQIEGFCFFSNVAIAARQAQAKYGVKKVAIVDWDIHHGDGTQKVFEMDDSVLFISLHRQDELQFYPNNPEAVTTYVGAD